MIIKDGADDDDDLFKTIIMESSYLEYIYMYIYIYIYIYIYTLHTNKGVAKHHHEGPSCRNISRM